MARQRLWVLIRPRVGWVSETAGSTGLHHGATPIAIARLLGGPVTCQRPPSGTATAADNRPTKKAESRVIMTAPARQASSPPS